MMENLRRQAFACPMEMLWIAVKALFETCFYTWFFYQNSWMMFLLLPVGVYKFVIYAKEMEQKNKKEFENQFQECILAVAAGLKAGYSLENAFKESIFDMRNLYGEKSLIVKELSGLCRGIGNNQTIETLLENMGRNHKSRVINEFAEIIKVAKYSGGDIVRIISTTAEIMSGERQVLSEIEVVVSGKKLEGRIMSVIPFFMVLYVSADNPEYFQVLYHNPMGVLVMSACLVVYLVATILMEKILRIGG